MLKVNLLPDEFKVAERASMGAVLLVAFCTIMSVSSLSLVSYLYFSVLNSAEAERNIVKEELDNLAPMAKYADDLDQEKKEYRKRSEVIHDIETTRILWTKKINQLLDVVHNKGDTERHWAWLKEMKVSMGSPRDPGVTLKGSVARDQFDQLSKFNEDLKNHDLYKEDFIAISNPTGSIGCEKKMDPSSAIEFSWEMKLKSKGVAAKPKKTPQQARAPGGK